MYALPDATRLCQGDVFSNLKLSFVTSEGELEVTPYDFLIVLSQDCDLQQDYDDRIDENRNVENQDKFIENVLVCPAFVTEQFKKGIHLLNIGLQMQNVNSPLWSPINNNNNARYHHLKPTEDFRQLDIVLDFKRFHTIPRDYLYKNLGNRITTLDDLHASALTQRFSFYLSRVALPELPNTEEQTTI